MDNIADLEAKKTKLLQLKADIENTLRILNLRVPKNININISPLRFQKSIRFDSVFFSYKDKRYIIKDLNLEISF